MSDFIEYDLPRLSMLAALILLVVVGSTSLRKEYHPVDEKQIKEIKTWVAKSSRAKVKFDNSDEIINQSEYRVIKRAYQADKLWRDLDV